MFGQWLPGQQNPLMLNPGMAQALAAPGGVPQQNPYVSGMNMLEQQVAPQNNPTGQTAFNPGNFLRNPSVSMALMQAGAKMLEGRKPGQTKAGLAGEALSTGLGTYVSNEDRKLRNDFLKQQMEQSKTQTEIAKKADTRAEGRSKREEALSSVDKRAKELQNETAQLALELNKKYGAPLQEAKLAKLGAETQKARADANAPAGGGQMSGDNFAISQLAGAYKQQAIRAGNTVPDDVIYTNALQDYMKIKESNPTPEEYNVRVMGLLTQNIKYDPLLSPEEYGAAQAAAAKQAQALTDQYRASIPDITKRGATLGVPTQPAQPTPTGAAPIPGSSPAQGGAGPQVAPPQAAGRVPPGTGLRWFQEKIAGNPNPTPQQLVAIRNYLKAQDPTFELPPEYLARAQAQQ